MTEKTTLRVAVDAGHGLNTAGKRTPDGEREWSFNNAVVLALIAELKRYENVEVLRLDDPTGKTDVPLTERTRKAKAWGANVIISVHHNANTSKWGAWGGVETLVHQSADKVSLALAESVQPAIVAAMCLRNRGVKRRSDLHILNAGKTYGIPAILTEGGFMDSTTDIGALRDKAKLQAQGKAIADGVAKVFALKMKEVVQPAPPKGETNVADEYKLTPNDEKVIADLKRWGITDGKNPTRPVTQLYLWHVVHGALQAVKDGRAAN